MENYLIKTEFDEDLKMLLKKSRLNFLCGAGASFFSVDGHLSFPLMSDLVEYIQDNSELSGKINGIKETNIIRKCYEKYLNGKKNVEEFLSSLEGLINYPMSVDKVNEINEIISLTKKLILERMFKSDESIGKEVYSEFYKKLLAFNEDKEENFKRINVFTTNYDMLNEISLEELNIHYFSGFYGLKKRKFNAAFYNYSYSDDMNLNTRNYLVKKDHVNLYKIHGSLSWKIEDDQLLEVQDYEKNSEPVIIYPSHTKYNNTNLIVYYSTLMREFLNQISKEQTTLISIGFSYSDEHINKLIESALTIDSFTLVALLYSDEDLTKFKKAFPNSKNAVIYKGDISTLTKFTSFMSELA